MSTTLTYGTVVDFLDALGEKVPRDGIMVLALQGSKLVRQVPGDQIRIALTNRPDEYDDLLIAIGSRKGVRVFEAFRGTTQPGAYFTQADPHPQGAANLTFGPHRFVLGDHSGRPAFRGKDELARVWRDKDGDHVFDLSEKIYVGHFGINIHPGGRGEYIGKWSAGCINVWGGVDGPQWARFYELGAEQVRTAGDLLVLVWRANDLDAFIRAGSPAAWKPTIYPGTVSIWVQHMLIGMDLQPRTNDYSGDYLTRVANWQRSKGLVADGIVGPKTWAAMKRA
jgi:peptidoglycan hydrolase-like protein with peptidoglycan-binding domain